MKAIFSATKLRQNLYNILDDVLRTGQPVEIERNGQKLKIVPEKPVNKMDRLEPHDTVIGDPEHILDITWEGAWSTGDPL
jgi:PHD/YefM family antitoxin component YafN of YafNO toxin-antitoxin module